MKLTEISISVSRTFNLGNLESLRVEASAAASIDDEDMDVARTVLLDECRLSLRRAWEEFKPSKAKDQLL